MQVMNEAVIHFPRTHFKLHLHQIAKICEHWQQSWVLEPGFEGSSCLLSTVLRGTVKLQGCVGKLHSTEEKVFQWSRGYNTTICVLAELPIPRIKTSVLIIVAECMIILLIT